MTKQHPKIDSIELDEDIPLVLEQREKDELAPDVAFSLTHDKFFKWVFARPQLGVSFLKQVLDKQIQKQLILEKLEVVSANRLDNKFKEFLADMIYEVPLKKGGITFIHIIIEHKSQNDYGAIFQLANYVMLLHAEEAKKFKKWKRNSRLSPIIPIILHHGKSTFKGETQLANVFRKLSGSDQHQLQMEAILFDLAAIDQEQLPVDLNCPELWPVLAAMKNVFRKKEGISTFKEIMEILKSYIDDSYYIELARHLVHYFGTNFKSLTDEEIKDMDATIEKTVGGNNMPEFQNSYYRTGRAQGIAIGKERGIAIGEERGEERGETRKQIQIAINLLKEGLSVEFISRITGLSSSEIEALRKQ